MSLLVVIVNYRSTDLAVDCLASLAPQIRDVPRTKVVVVDSASGDGSAQRLRAAIDNRGWSDWVALTPLDRNGGFAFGNNAAIRTALEAPECERPDFVLLLNPDTIARPGALVSLVEFLRLNPTVGIAGSRLEWADGTQHDSRYRFPSILGEFEHGLRFGPVSRLLERWAAAPPLVLHDHQIDWVAGASMLVRREVFEGIGLLDETYFLYYEEVDFCLRAARAGWPCWYVPVSRVVHLVGQSSGVTNAREPARRRPRYWFESRAHYFRKNHGRCYALAADVAFAVGYGLWRLRRLAQRLPDEDPPRLWRDFVSFAFFSRVRPGPVEGT